MIGFLLGIIVGGYLMLQFDNHLFYEKVKNANEIRISYCKKIKDACTAKTQESK